MKVPCPTQWAPARGGQHQPRAASERSATFSILRTVQRNRAGLCGHASAWRVCIRIRSDLPARFVGSDRRFMRTAAGCFYGVPLLKLKDRRHFREHLVHDRCGQGVHLARIASTKIEHTRLLAANDAGYFDARDGDSEPLRRAKSPRVIVQITGNLVASLNSAGDTTRTRRLPRCSRPSVGSSETR